MQFKYRGKSWPTVLAGFAVLVLLLALPPVNRVLLAGDIKGARLANTLIGQSPILDRILMGLNNRHSDHTVGIMFLIFCLGHTLWPRNREEAIRRMAFWAWCVACFVAVYGMQEMLEDGLARKSPSIMLDGWRDLGRMYHRGDLKIRSDNCFPSGHASVYWFMAFMALPRYRSVGVWLLAMALVLPATRIPVGAHWPSDIFLGSLPLTLVCALVCYESPIRKVEGWTTAVLTLGERLLFARDGFTPCQRIRAAASAFGNPSSVRTATDDNQKSGADQSEPEAPEDQQPG